MADSNTSAVTRADFESFKIEIKKELSAIAEKLENKIDKQISSIKYWGIGGVTIFCVVFTAIYGFLFYFVNDQIQNRIDKIESAVFIPKDDKILNEIRDLKMQFSAIQGGHLRFHTAGDKRKQQGTKRKINDVGSRELSSVKEESH